MRATAKKGASMKISQAAAASGLTVKTVRYYANIGLVSPTIDNCRELLALYEDKDSPSRDVKKIAMNEIADIGRRLGELRRLKSELAALRTACDGDDRPHFPIIDGLAGARYWRLS